MTLLDDEVVEALAARVLETLSSRGPGHCLQVAHVPMVTADAACEMVTTGISERDTATVVVADPDPEKPWQARPSRVVELRNLAEETGGRLILFLPAGQHLAAEDSFGRSTFEVLDLDDLDRQVVDRLRRKLRSTNSELAERAEAIATVARRDAKFGVGERDVAAYFARLVETPSLEEAGRGVVELGLLPDSALASEEPDGLSVRLARNLQHIEALTDLSPPADRIQALVISPELPEADDIRVALVEALHDGTVDRHELARRLDGDGDGAAAATDFGPVIAAAGLRAFLHELSIVGLSGPFQPDSDPLTLNKADASIKIRYRCRPAADTVEGLRQLRLELLQITDQGGELSETGIEATKGERSLPRNAEATWSVKVPTQNLDSGLYRLRLRAIDSDNHPLKEALSEPFRIHEEIEETEDDFQIVVSVPAARVEASLLHPERAAVGEPRISAVDSEKDDKRTLWFTLRFDGTPGRWRLGVSRLLAQVEAYAFAAPRSLARYRISLATNELEETLLPESHLTLPEDFLEAREKLFGRIQQSQYSIEAAAPLGPLIELCDLSALSEPIARYVDTWAAALDTTPDEGVRRALLSVDQVTFTDGPLADGVLIGPMHPLRLAWLADYQRTLEEWLESTEAREAEGSEVSALLRALAPANVPHVVVTEHGELRHLEPLDLHWGIWAPPAAPDVGALAGIVRKHLELPRSAVGGIAVADVVQRIRRYLAAHPYVELLEMNFVQPGEAQLVLQALLQLQSDRATEHLRYVVRLFATELSRSELGRGLDEFMAEPEAMKTARRNEADAFLSSTDDPLTPKLIYSKHAVQEFLSSPERFPAHLTFFLDWFELDVVPVPPEMDRRSFYAGRLIVDPVVVYRAGSDELNPQWDEHVAPAPIDEGSFVRAYAAAERATSLLLGADAGGTVPAIRLELDRVRRSILDAVHRHSDWVVVIDPVFTDEYLDALPEQGEAPRYLIDSTDPGALETNRRIMISTRSRAELGNLLRPILAKYELEVDADRVDVLMDALRALSAGLPLKLLNNPTQGIEALSLSLAALYLANRGVLRRALVVPLDLHQDLFREPTGSDIEEVDLRRTDLAIIRMDPESRRISVSLVEVKARGELPNPTPSELVEHIDAQLENSRQVLRRRLFSADVRRRKGSLAGTLMVRRLTRILTRYAERAVRYRFLDPKLSQSLRPFLASLDRSFTVSFEKHALLFDLDGESLPSEQVGDLHIQRIGRAEILDLLNRTQTPVGTQLPQGEDEAIETVFEPNLGAKYVEEVPELHAAGNELADKADAEDEQPSGATQEPEEPPSEPGRTEGPRAEDVLQLGSTQDSTQFGIVGRLHSSGRNVAFDVDGTNVISVFGVQGSGKSYTVGNLIEAALLHAPEVNRLPHPLAAVVFHYSSNETYLPEFAAMADPNDDRLAEQILNDEYGVAVQGVEDVRILVPSDLVAERRQEFPGVEVHPLILSTAELTLADWKLLMGVDGGDQLYVKAMTNIFRQLRGGISLGALRDALEHSSLTPQQKSIAETRIAFVELFATDEGGAARHVAPGRLLIVDVRDPLMDEGDVLSLFMVLLHLFSQTRDEAGRKFSKLIVFDEAHKYMDNTRLTGAIVEMVKEMRHLGTSVVIASQNPPSVPRDVIELSSVLIAHKFTSPQWLEHIRKVNGAFGRDLAPPQLAALSPGEAFVWSRDGAEELRRPQRVRMRPRLSRHGGGTRRAGDA